MLIRLKKLDTAFIIREKGEFEAIVHPDASIAIEDIDKIIRILEKLKRGEKDIDGDVS